ncbi:hypothetical protein [Amycolatopsis benzoatilytica]|uniref:hypothetical protein n=1 Tax=Amycolatopsis benzoatilytica TaxID=346045 RepID=UPI000685F32A|nr:hypothetical protein [Amycolatopsis benzoatilytica]
MKSVIWWSIGLLFGLGLVAIGLFSTGDTTGGKVLCGGEEMRPGTYCEETSYGQKSQHTYEEKLQDQIDSAKSFNNGGNWITAGVGGVIAAGCGWRLVVAIRRVRRRGTASTESGEQMPIGQGTGGQPPSGFPAWSAAQQPGFQPGQGSQRSGYPQTATFPPGYPQAPGFPPPTHPQTPGFQQQGYPPDYAQPATPPPPGFPQQPGHLPQAGPRPE